MGATAPMCGSTIAGAQARKGNNVLELHPTVKPVQLVMDALLDCSNRGDTVIDSFLGSGTTLLRRRCEALNE
jgi:DNA methylase